MPCYKFVVVILCVVLSSYMFYVEAKVFSKDLLNSQLEAVPVSLTRTPSGVGLPELDKRYGGSPGQNNSRQRRSADSPTALPSGDRAKKLQVHTTKLPDSEHNEAIVHWSGVNSTVMFILTRQRQPNGSIPDSSLWRSENGGTSFMPVDQIDKSAVISYYHFAPSDKNTILFVDQKNNIIYWTQNEGKTFKSQTSINCGKSADKMLFHPKNPKWVLCYSESDRKLSLTTDFGVSYDLVSESVNPRFFWAVEGVDTDNTTIHMEVLDSATGHYIYKTCISPYIESNCKKDNHLGYIEVDSLLVENEYIFVQKTSQFSTWLYVSYNRQPFRMALFPRNRHPQDINIVNADERQVFIAGSNRNGLSTLYLSNMTGQVYITSLEQVLLGDAGLYEIQGLRGVYLANQDMKKGFQTLISFDLGGEWSRIPAPKTVADGQPSNCKLEDDCSLHLNLGVFSRDMAAVVSSKNAPGLLFAQGKIGQLWTAKGNTSLFRSTDGGALWKFVFDGFYHSNILDQGGAIVLVPETLSRSATNVIHYSCDEGTTWEVYSFRNDTMRVDGVLNEPGISTLIVVIFGHDSEVKGWEIVKVDFSHLLPFVCKPESYTKWVPSDLTGSDDGCLLGQTIEYTRRKADAQCQNTAGYTPGVLGTPCQCTWEDFECDYGYERSANVSGGRLQCVASSWFDPSRPIRDCESIGTFVKSLGYRKVASDVCVDGVEEQFSGVVTPCPVMRPDGLHLNTVSGDIVASGKQVTFQLLQEWGSKQSTKYTWDFGEDIGEGGTKQRLIVTGYDNATKQTHTYNKAATYRVNVMAENPAGRASVDLQVIVQDKVRGLYVVTPHGAQAGQPVLFDAILVQDMPFSTRNPNVHFLWFYGDEEQGNKPEVTWEPKSSHVYSKSGNYTLHVEAMNGVGSAFYEASVPVYGLLQTVQLGFETGVDFYNEQNDLWRNLFGLAIKRKLTRGLAVDDSRLEVVVLPSVPTTVDVSILPEQQSMESDPAINKITVQLVKMVNAGQVFVILTRDEFDVDANISVTSIELISAGGGGTGNQNRYLAVYVCIPILVAAIFVSFLVALYYKKTFSAHQRRYRLLQGQAEAPDSLLDDTDDDDPPLDPNPDETNQRLALSDDDMSSDPLGLLRSDSTADA